LLKAIIDEDSQTPRGAAGLDVAPAVTDQIAALKIDRAFRSSLKDHPGLRLTTGAAVGIGMETDLDIVDREFAANACVHGLDYSPRGQPSCNVGLIGDHHDDKSLLLEARNGLRDTGQELELAEARGGNGTSVAEEIGVYHSIPVKKDGPV
jgi:hypothetical protein